MTGAASPEAVRIEGGAPLKGRLRPPGDKSISHRAVLIGSLIDGVSTADGLNQGDDVQHSIDAVRRLGAEVHDLGSGRWQVVGGRRRWRAPELPLECGNSGTTMRLLAGLLAPCPWRTVLTGDASLSARPMDRVASPLRAMGASITGRGERCLPPLEVTGGALRGVEWRPELASAQVKSAVLLAGLEAEGDTVVHEPVTTRTHTEELLALAGASLTVETPDGGRIVRVRRSTLRPFEVVVPGDPSQAAFWVVAASIVPDSELRVEAVYRGPARLGFLDVLRRMGAEVRETPTAPRGDAVDLEVRAAPLHGTVVHAAQLPSLDEVPVLAVAAAAATGRTGFLGVSELRVKESDRLRGVRDLVRAFGAKADVDGDDLWVEGTGGGLTGGAVDSCGDHRLAMAAAVGALSTRTASVITGWRSVETSYPSFLADLERLAGNVVVSMPAASMPAASMPVARAETPCDRGLVIAIDGPAGSGKSSVAGKLADRLGLPRLDTGAMYRALTWLALVRGVDPEDGPAVTVLARGAAITVDTHVVADGTDVTDAVRSPEVSRAVSIVAAHPGVRQVMVERQRAWVARHASGGIVEGRDIGSVVLPHADLKVYLTAIPEVRARRRKEEAAAALERRDQLDSTRPVAPLAVAPDARVIDTSSRDLDAIVDEIVSWCRR